MDKRAHDISDNLAASGCLCRDEAVVQKHLVFVYGTLRLDAINDLSFFVPGSEYVTRATVPGKLYDLGWYPGIKLYEETSGSVPVIGDVFRVSDEGLARLDEYEGVPTLYSRIRAKTNTGHEVFVYEFNGDVSSEPVIPSGDWLEYLKELTVCA